MQTISYGIHHARYNLFSGILNSTPVTQDHLASEVWLGDTPERAQTEALRVETERQSLTGPE